MEECDVVRCCQTASTATTGLRAPKTGHGNRGGPSAAISLVARSESFTSRFEQIDILVKSSDAARLHRRPAGSLTEASESSETNVHLVASPASMIRVANSPGPCGSPFSDRLHALTIEHLRTVAAAHVIDKLQQKDHLSWVRSLGPGLTPPIKREARHGSLAVIFLSPCQAIIPLKPIMALELARCGSVRGSWSRSA